MKKPLTILLSASFLVAFAYFVVWFGFQHDGRSWLNDRGQVLATNCKSVMVGDSVDVVTQKMGQPDVVSESDGITTFLYFRGGLVSDRGMAFEFKQNKLIKTNCTE